MIKEIKIVFLHDGTKEYRLDGKLHREDGPAVECTNGNKYWYFNDKLHREDGPAVEYKNGIINFWYLDGKIIYCTSQEEFMRIARLKILL